MIIANFSDKKYATASGLWQWDYGQVLRIQGLSLPTAVEIHFSLQEKGGEATTRIGTTKDGVTDVVIPDSMLENGGTSADYAVYAFVYLTDDNSGETEYKIKMPVRTRPKPEGFTGSSDTSMAAIIKTVNEIADDKVSVPSVAKVGQVIAVKAVDESGKPTEFEVVDQGGGVSDEKIGEALESYMEANPQKDVSYEPQELTNEQKTQARTNIGAASFGGYTAGKNVVTDASGNIATEEKPKIPSKTSDLQNDSGFLTEHQDLSGYATKEEIPKTASEVGADAVGTAESKVSEHNVATDAHSDIRLLIEGLTTRLNALADSDDTTLDQMSEVVAYIKSNKSLIDAITTSKLSVSDIIDNLTTNASNKPLSAAQGVALKALIDGIVVPTKTSELENDRGYMAQPETAQVGQIFKVKSINDDGTLVLEAVDMPTGGGSVDDVQINGTSIVENGIANIPNSDTSKYTLGLVKCISGGYAGIKINNGEMVAYTINNQYISFRQSVGGAYFSFINTDNFDHVVKIAMCDGQGDTWTDTERIAALLRMGCTVDDNGFVKWTAQEET